MTEEGPRVMRQGHTIDDRETLERYRIALDSGRRHGPWTRATCAAVLRTLDAIEAERDRLNAEANELTNRAEAAEAKAIVLEAALRKIANEPPDRGLTPNFRQFARDVLEAYDRG